MVESFSNRGKQKSVGTKANLLYIVLIVSVGSLSDQENLQWPCSLWRMNVSLCAAVWLIDVFLIARGQQWSSVPQRIRYISGFRCTDRIKSFQISFFIRFVSKTKYVIYHRRYPLMREMKRGDVRNVVSVVMIHKALVITF